MVLNIVFLAGGVCVGYLLRGEIDRRKSKKAWSVALDEGLKIAEKLVNDITSVKKNDGDEDINLDSITNLFDIADSKNESNSTDETIQL